MDRLDAMQAFVRVAELGSFAAAAQQMNVARSVVTRQIAALERYLGVKLMVRSTRRLTLTSAGAAYLEKCRVILTMLDSAEGEVAAERHTPRGHIRLSVPLSFGLKRLTPLLLQFAQHYPEVQLETEYSDRHAHLIEEGIDLIGYTTWGCIDLVSAGTGEMRKRYGFIYVDKDNAGHGTLARSKKDSFDWYKKVIESNGEKLWKNT